MSSPHMLLLYRPRFPSCIARPSITATSPHSFPDPQRPRLKTRVHSPGYQLLRRLCGSGELTKFPIQSATHRPQRGLKKHTVLRVTTAIAAVYGGFEASDGVQRSFESRTCGIRPVRIGFHMSTQIHPPQAEKHTDNVPRGVAMLDGAQRLNRSRLEVLRNCTTKLRVSNRPIGMIVDVLTRLCFVDGHVRISLGRHSPAGLVSLG